EAQKAGKKLETEIRAVAAYPKEVEALVRNDIDSLKNRFQIPQLDVKDMAMALFSKELGGYISQARKYQALAKQYLPEKKEREEVLPPPRSVGKSYEFPITKSYPLFWLKKAAISSKGTADSYSG
ncbi:MAG: TIGR03545 family protein, partial [bacterium]